MINKNAMNRHSEDLAKIARDLAAKIFQEAETKRVFKEALNEWLDKKYEGFQLSFARKSLQAITVMLFAALITFVMWSQGYSK